MKQKRPSKKVFFISVAVFILTAGFGILLLISGGKKLKIPESQYVVPGEYDLTLNETGSYTIYLQTHTVADGKTYSAPEDLKGLKCEVEKDGKKIKVDTASLDYSYNKNGKSGRSILEFKADAKGVYHLKAALKGQEAVIAVDKTNTKVMSAMMDTVGAVLLFLIGIFQLLGFMTYGIIKNFLYKRQNNL